MRETRSEEAAVRVGGAGAAPAAILAEIAADLAAGSDLRALLQRFLEPITRLAGAQAGAVRILSEPQQSLQLVSEIGLPAGVRCAERSVDRHCGVCGQAASEDRIVWTSDLRPCSRRTQEGYFGEACARMLAVPMQHRGRVLGVYNLFFTDGGEPSREIAAVLKSIGELLGLALDNARLERDNLRATLTHERQMIAAEVHDSIAQTLAFAKMRLPLLHEAVAEHDDARALKYLSDVREALGEAHTSLRAIINEFRAPVDPLGLAHAVQVSVDAFRERTGVAIAFVDEASELDLSTAQETQAIHIVREALANVAKHALATEVRVTLALQDGEVEIVVEDDGAGLAQARCAASPALTEAHHGIAIMGERARRLGGAIEFGARKGGGTRVRLHFPLRPGAVSVTA